PEAAGEFIEGESGQDFMLATAEAFFGRDAVDFVGFIPASESPLKTLWYFLSGLRLRGLLRLKQSMKTPPSPLALEYFSQTPYRLGPHCVKYSVRPLTPRKAKYDPWYLWPVVRTPIGWAVKVKIGRASCRERV